MDASHTPRLSLVDRLRAGDGALSTVADLIGGTLMVVGGFIALALVGIALSLALIFGLKGVGLLDTNADAACRRANPPQRCWDPSPLPQEPNGPLK